MRARGVGGAGLIVRVVVRAAAVVAASACADGVSNVPRPNPARIEIVASPASAVQAGTAAGTFSVRVTAADGASLAGVVVRFAASVGSGRVSPTTDTTAADGVAATQVQAGAMPGANEIVAIVPGLNPAKATILGTAGETRSLALMQHRVRFAPGRDSIVLTAFTRDSVANPTVSPIVWTVSDPTLLSVVPAQSNTAVIKALRRPGETWVLAASGVSRDSARIAVHDSTTSPCEFLAEPQALAVGQTMALDSGVVCLRGGSESAEYALVAHYNSAVAGIATGVEAVGHGISTLPATLPIVEDPGGVATPVAGGSTAAEHALRERERRELPAWVTPMRAAWRSGSRTGGTLGATAVPSIGGGPIPPAVREGDRVVVNANAIDFCANPTLVTARVAAITQRAVILADTANPAGGFTDAEYRALGITIDTLVHPVLVGAFGEPTDIDGNGRVGVLFTRKVNELTRRGADSFFLGLYYLRDLLPKTSAFGACPGSNASELFYLLVPDPNGEASDARSKALVRDVAVSTIAHEYQHLINASRRMYVTDAPQVSEEIWLNEGLSHVAEELLFFRASGLGPRANIDGAQLPLGTVARDVYGEYQAANLKRYRLALLAPELHSPLAADDQLATRGATWSFLRYLADRVGATDGDFWRRLVDARVTGVANLDEVLGSSGLTTRSALRDWSLSLIADDQPGAPPHSQQASWNFLTVMPATGVGSTPALSVRNPSDALPLTIGLRAGASAFLRFGVTRNLDALLMVSGTGSGGVSSGTPLPPGVTLTLIRIR